MNQVASVASAIVMVALVATIVQSPFTSDIIGAFGNAFSGSIAAARKK